MKQGGSRLYRLLSAICIAANILLLAGCSTVGKPVRSGVAAIRNHEKSLVLMRAVQYTNGAVRPLRLEDFRILDVRAEFSSRGQSLSRKAADKISGDQGWFYAVMDPGSYLVTVGPSGNATTHVPDRRYYLSISSDSSVVYAGTLVFVPATLNLPTWTGSLKPTTVFEPHYVTNEIGPAKVVVASALPGFGDVGYCPLLSYGNLSVALTNLSHGRGVKAEAGPQGKPFLKGDNFQAALIASSPLWLPGVVLLSAAGYGGGGEAAGYMAAAGAALVVAAVPVIAVVAPSTMGVHYLEWKPYRDVFEREVGQFNLPQQLANAVNSRLPTAVDASVTNNAPAFFIELEPYRVCLRGNDSQKFHLEIAVRLTMFDAQRERVVWQNSYVYPGQEDAKRLSPHEKLVGDSSAGQRLKEHKQDHGAQWFRDQLRHAIDDLSERIAKNFQTPGL